MLEKCLIKLLSITPALLALLSKEMYCEDMNIDHKITSNQEGIFNKM